MDPFTAAQAVVSAFQAVYLTSRFIYREVLRAKGFHDGRAKMAQAYRKEILRLKAFWVEILELIYTYLSDIGADLSTYSRFAGQLDDEYQKYYVQTSLLAADTKKIMITLPPDLDDAVDPTTEELNAEKGVLEGTPGSDAKTVPQQTGLFHGFFGGSNSNKQPTVVLKAKWREIPEGIAWCFQERQLNKSLKKLRNRVKDLNDLSPALLVSLDQNSAIAHTVNTGRAFKDFRGHMRLQQMAKDYKDEIPGSGAASIPWETMKGYIHDSERPSSKLLIERKETEISPGDSIGREAKRERSRERAEQTKYAPQLASLLTSSGRDYFEGTTLGTLPFKGFSKDPTAPNISFCYAFDYPDGALDNTPLSLHDMILSDKIEHNLSLNHRFHVAKMISRYLGTLHSDGWLHKSIRSHAVKFFFRMSDKAAVLDTSTPYLTEFGFSRPVDAFSAYKYSASTAVDLDRDVYRHPQRFGKPSYYFTKVHDVYSLGVVLLEIGLWKTARQMYDEAFESAKKEPLGEDVKAEFLRRAKQELQHHMGSAYRDAVLLCLEGDDNVRKQSFAVEFQKSVVRKVDAAFLNPEVSGFDDEAEPPPYDAVSHH
ncbi:hypothetical protein F5Y07DRAFT_387067 [Xylaria sp. FL0933]|nr:hypothetical protein F5Y07DRAFT_387067 [Xylaria sp. FL0933]